MNIDEIQDLLNKVGEEGLAAHAPGVVEKLVNIAKLIAKALATLEEV